MIDQCASDGASAEAGRYSAKAIARADVLETFAGVLGGQLPRQDALEAFAAADDITLRLMGDVLSQAGLTCSAQKVRNLEAQDWPAIAEMTSGQVILVLDQEGDSLTIYDTTCPDNRAYVPLAEFKPYFSGTMLRAKMAAQTLAQKHGTTAGKGHWFWSQFLGYRRIFGEIVLGSLVANMLAVAVAMFSLHVYDRVIPHESTATLWVLAIGALVAIMLEAGLRVARARLMDGAGRRIEFSVQKLLMERVLGMQRGLPNQSPSQLFSAVKEFGSIREFFTASTIGSLSDLPFIVLFLALVASIAGPVVWVLILGGIIMVLPSFFLQKRMMELTKQTQGAGARSNRLLHEVIYDSDTIKSQRGEDRFRQIWGELIGLSAVATSKQRQLASMLTYWAQAVQQATYVSAVVVGAFMVFAGEYTVGTIIAVGILTSRTLGPLTQLAGTLARWSNVKTALDALEEIAHAPQDLEAGRSYLRRETFTGDFELRDLNFVYGEDEAVALDIGGMAIKAGQRVALLGANGSGKSTLLRLLTGIYHPTKGRVLIDGIDMAQVSARDLRRAIGYLGQEVRLFSGSLRENLNLNMLERDDERMLAALDFAGLGHFVRNHPKGLDMQIGDGGGGLSIGQRQSMGWARMWLQDPQICILDEPTAALDQTLEAALVKRLDEWLADRTAIIATHRMPLLTLVERVAVLQNGRLAVDGPRDQVMAHLKDKEAI